MQLRLFGGARLEARNEPVRGRAAHRRRLAVLALLAATERGGLTRERIVSLLWPEDDAERGRRQLSEALYLIRKELGDDTIQSAGESVQLGPGVDSDVAAFRRAISDQRYADAVALYSAPFLDAWYVDRAPEFERWASDMREAYRSDFVRALVRLADDADQRGDSLDSIDWLTRLVREDPYSPKAVVRLADSLRSAGESAAALRVLAAHIERVQADLDLPASSEVITRIADLREEKSEGPRVSTTPTLRKPRDERTEGDATHAASRLEPDSDGIYQPRGPQAPRPKGLDRSRGIVWLIATVAIAIVAVVLFMMKETPSTGALDPRHVAVLYFDDHSEGRRLGHIAEGLTEELIHQLAQVPALRVVSRHGVKRFRSVAAPPDSIAVSLSVGSLIEGSIQQSGDSLRVTVQLIDGNSGMHVESRSFARLRTELFAMEAEAAGIVATALRRRVGQAVTLRTLAEGRSSDAALEKVLRARSARNDAARVALHSHEKDVQSARDLLRQAEAWLASASRLDPTWTRPPLERGWVQLQLARLVGGAQAQELRTRAATVAGALLKTQPSSVDARHLRGTALWHQVASGMLESPDSAMTRSAEQDLRIALNSDSTLASAWATLADILNVRGALAEAVATAERAVSHDAWLDGADETYFMAFAASVLMEQYDAAMSWCKRGQQVFPESWRFFECELTTLREDHRSRADPARAWGLVAKLDSLDPPDLARAAGAHYRPIYRRAVAAAVSARARDTARARREVDELRARVSPDTELSLDLDYEEAYVRYLLGDTDRSRAMLDRLFRFRPMLRTQMARDPLVKWLAEKR